MAEPLLEPILAGDRKAWEEWVRRAVPVLHRVLVHHIRTRGYAGGSEAVEKILTEFFRGLLAHERKTLREIQEGGINLETWMEVRARALCRDYFVSAAAGDKNETTRIQPSPAASASGETAPGGVEDPAASIRREAHRAFRLLSSKDRLILRLLTHNKMKYVEVAMAVKGPPKGVGLAIVRLKHRVRQRLEGSGQAVPEEVKI